MSEQVFRIEGITIVGVDDIRPNPRNPNKHTEAQLQRLAKIMQASGVRRPLTVSKQTGLLTVGHGRLEAAKLLGWDKMPVSYQDYDDEDQEYADMVADNAIAEWASLDLSAINYEVQNFSPDFNIDMLGINNFKIDVSEKVSFDAKVGSKELDEGDFQHFDHTCPKCSFGFND
jgi:hypothetical protein